MRFVNAVRTTFWTARFHIGEVLWSEHERTLFVRLARYPRKNWQWCQRQYPAIKRRQSIPCSPYERSLTNSDLSGACIPRDGEAFSGSESPNRSAEADAGNYELSRGVRLLLTHLLHVTYCLAAHLALVRNCFLTSLIPRSPSEPLLVRLAGAGWHLWSAVFSG